MDTHLLAPHHTSTRAWADLLSLSMVCMPRCMFEILHSPSTHHGRGPFVVMTSVSPSSLIHLVPPEPSQQQTKGTMRLNITPQEVHRRPPPPPRIRTATQTDNHVDPGISTKWTYGSRPAFNGPKGKSASRPSRSSVLAQKGRVISCFQYGGEARSISTGMRFFPRVYVSPPKHKALS